MKKKKLSEMSLNAATLNNKTPDYYNFRNFGLGIGISGNVILDYNENLETGFYVSFAGTPNEALAASFFVINIKRTSGSCLQIAFRVSGGPDNSIYTRRKISGTWEEWSVWR